MGTHQKKTNSKQWINIGRRGRKGIRTMWNIGLRGIGQGTNGKTKKRREEMGRINKCKHLKLKYNNGKNHLRKAQKDSRNNKKWILYRTNGNRNECKRIKK